MKRWYLALLGSLLALAPIVSTAQTIDVLWYAYSPPGSETQYREEMQELADDAHTAGSGVRWEVTFFGPGDEPPDFAAFDALVVQSSFFDVFDSVGGSLYAGILDNEHAIEAARGSRTLITGLDPDFEYIFLPGSPREVLINFVNWAGSGTGLGIVALQEFDVNWLTKETSFLREDVLGWQIFEGLSTSFIADFAADYPINAGLTDAALGNATTGFHLSMPGYAAIHRTESQFPEIFGEFVGVTMVTASEAAGATTPVAEYWCKSLLPPLDRAVSLAPSSRRMIPIRMQLLDGMGNVVTAEDLSQPPQLQVRFGATARLIGPFSFNAGAGVWTAMFNSSAFPAAGTYTVEAVAGNGSYEVELCEQTVTRR